MQAQCGKLVIAVSEDIDPRNSDAIFWSLAYRSDFTTDLLSHAVPVQWSRPEIGASATRKHVAD